MYKKLLFIVMLGLLATSLSTAYASTTELHYCYEENGEETCETVDDARERAKQIIERYGLAGPSPNSEACNEEPNPCLFDPIAEFAPQTSAIDFIRELWGAENETILVITESEQKYLLNLGLEELIWISEPIDFCTPLYCIEWDIFTPINCHKVCQATPVSDMSIGDLWEYLNEDATTLLLQDMVDGTTYMLDNNVGHVLDLNQYPADPNEPIELCYEKWGAEICQHIDGNPLPLPFDCLGEECPIIEGPIPHPFDAGLLDVTTELFAQNEGILFLTTEANQYILDLDHALLVDISVPTEICTPLYCIEWEFYHPANCAELCASTDIEELQTAALTELVTQDGGLMLLQNREGTIAYALDFTNEVIVEINK